MKKTNHQRTNIMTIRLTALLVAVVFVVGTMLVPAELYAAESETGEAQAAVTEEAATEPVNEEPAAEQTVEPTEATEPETTEATNAPEETNEAANDLSEALTVDLDSVDEDTYDGFIYKLKDDTTRKEIKEMESSIDDLQQEQDVREVIDKEVYAADSLETIEEVVDPSLIEYIEPDYIIHACAVPNDPEYNSFAWQLNNTNVPYVWDRGITGSGAVVAVLDTGVNMYHEDLKGVRFVNQRNAFDGSSNVTDVFGHGTNVTGIIAERRNNGIGFTGILSGVSIMPVKVLRDDGKSNLSYLITGMEYAISKKVDVINMSLGGSESEIGDGSRALEETCEKAVDNGCIVVAASGNIGKEGNVMYYPGGYDCVVSVASVDANNQHASTSIHNNKVTVAAPGHNVRLVDINGYGVGSGTSYATPQVSAMAAMLKSINHGINQTQFMEILRSTSKDLGPSGYDEYYGYGLIDFGKAFEYIMADLSTYQLSLSGTVYDYNGSAKAPSVTLSYGSIKLINGRDYRVSYPSGRTAVGTYRITVSGINGYHGSRTATFQIRPPLVKSIKAPKRGKKKLTVRWKAMSSSQKSKYKSAITGYQVRVARKANFSNAKYKKVKGISKTSVTVKGLKKKKTYYVQYRSYKVVGSTTYYSKWSSKKKAKTK